MKRALILLTGIFLMVAGCVSSPDTPPAPTPILPTATPTEVKTLPTPFSPGAKVTWENMQVGMISSEITADFATAFGSQRVPPPGSKFLWVHVNLKNLGDTELALPAAEHFSVLYADSEFKPTYGHRAGYIDYTSLSTPLYPAASVDAWLRFDIPVTAELNELRFVFLPESAEVGGLPSSPGYPWLGQHPVFVWECDR